jgi:superfamily I DNA/RNA helicase
MEEGRTAATDSVVGSDADKRLIVAGPGTGKSFTFKKALAQAIEEAGEGKGLALTFIRNLVADLQRDLGELLADVNTFHGYCKGLMHHHIGELAGADLYPLLIDLLAEDLKITGKRKTSKKEIEEHLQTLDTADGLINEAMENADYYNAVSFPDLVYRVLEHFRANNEDIPAYPLVVVDEYQDFSRLETAFIELLATKSRVLVAGDDDQALYSKFRWASPNFIRELAAGNEYERFELPYCSRCTEVVVAAVKDVIGAAVNNGNLVGRLEKEFVCYLPEKQLDSEANPRLIHVECSTAKEPYAGRYIAQQIARIPPEDIAISREKGYPTALVIGPNPFLRRAFEVVRERFPQARMKMSEQFSIDPLDAYSRIAKNEKSRLGWRILASCNRPKGWKKILKQALEEDVDLVELLPEDYVKKHLEIAQLLATLIEAEQLDDADEQRLCTALERTIKEVREQLELEPVDVEEAEMEESGGGEENAEAPDILFTSLVGAKGLSAEHVFIVGLNNGHLPRDAKAIADDEICGFLVGLSRTRKRCHVISFRFFINKFQPPSVFLGWINDHLETITVNKDYDFSEALEESA